MHRVRHGDAVTACYWSMQSRIQPNRIVQIREGSTAVTLDDALVDVSIAFLQVEFSIKLLSYCELDRIRPAEFDTHQVVLLEQESLAFPIGRFSTQEEIVRAAMVAVSLALAGSALTLDKA